MNVMFCLLWLLGRTGGWLEGEEEKEKGEEREEFPYIMLKVVYHNPLSDHSMDWVQIQMLD